MEFVAKYRVNNITWLQKFIASSWEHAEQICNELDMYDLGLFIEEVE